MKKWIIALAGLIAASAFSVQSADAHSWRHKKVGKGVVVAGAVTGAAATAGYFWINDWKWNWRGEGANGISQTGAIAATSIACMAVAPMLASALEGRELTLREAGVLFGGCVVPIIGGYLVNAAWDANPQWEQYEKKPVRAAHRHHRHHRHHR
ncbi:MAG: hypothetical protein ACTHLY_21790 [Pseudolabrys sp.]